jgi:hypothetical protein
MKKHEEWQYEHSYSIRDVGIRWRCVVSFTPRSLYLRFLLKAGWTSACLDAVKKRHIVIALCLINFVCSVNIETEMFEVYSEGTAK